MGEELYSQSFGGHDNLECYECAYCAGEVPLVYAKWLPSPIKRLSREEINGTKPFCSDHCFELYKKENTIDLIFCIKIPYLPTQHY